MENYPNPMSDWRVPNHRVTLRDIAEKVGLSHSAVSLALRNSGKVSKETCQRVQKAAQEMGYRPNAMGAGLAYLKKTSSSKPIEAALAWLNCWPDPRQLRRYKEFDLYWQGATACAEKFGYRIDEFHLNADMTIHKLGRILRARNITGVIVPPGPYANLEGFNWEDFAVVHFGHTSVTMPAYSVTSDQLANSMLAYDVLRQKGFQRVGYVGTYARERPLGSGFLWAQSNLPEDERIPAFHPFSHESKYLDELKAYIERWEIDAILTEIIDLESVLKRIGYRVPEDIFLAATSVLDCPIKAGIYQNSEEIGRVCVLALISLINDHDLGMPPIHREILIKGRWVDGPEEI